MRSFFALLLVIGLAVPPGSASIFGSAGSTEFKNGQKAEAAGDYDTAVQWYQKAFDKDRKNMTFETTLRRTRFTAGIKHVDAGHKLRDLGKLDEALAEFQKARIIDPSTAISEQEINRTLQMIEARKASGNAADALTPQQKERSNYEKRMMRAEGPAELQPVSRARINARWTNESKVIFETIGKLAGINVLTDPDYQGRRITIELVNSTLEEALDYAAIMSKTKWTPISSNTIVIYQDSRARDHDPLIMKTFYLTNTVKDTEITEITQVLRNMLENIKLMQVNSQNAIVIRASPDQMAIAEKIINDIDKAKSEVVVDVTVLAVERDLSKTLGITPVSNGAPGLSLPATFTGGTSTVNNNNINNTGTTTTTPTDVTGTTTTPTGNIIPLNGIIHTSINQFSTTLPGASLSAILSDAHTKILQNPQVRASDGQTAKLRVGERVPIATGTFSTGIVATGGLPAAQTSFQYTDVGVIMEITPRVNGLHEVSIKLVIEISAVNSYVTIGGVSQPVIGQRRVEQDIRLKEGEINVLGGIIQDQTSVTKAGVPLLGSLPLIGHFFSQDQTTISQSEVLIVLTPHIVRSSDLSELNLRGIDTGTATNTAIRYRGTDTAAPSAPPAPPASTTPGSTTTPPTATQQPAANPPAGAPPAGAPPIGMDQASSGGMQLRFTEGTVKAVMGTNFTLNLELAGAQEVNAVPFQVRFDPKVLRLSNVAAGDFLNKDGQQASMVPTIDADSGTGMIALTRPPTAPGVSGTGRLVVLTFQPVAPGTATVQVFGATARGPGHEPKSLAAVQAAVTVTAPK